MLSFPLSLKTAISVLLVLLMSITRSLSLLAISGNGGDHSGSSLGSKEYKLKRISTYMEYVHNETYVGDSRRSRRGEPPYSQRTSMLFFQRENSGDALVWMALALGRVMNGYVLISDKRRSLQRWQAGNPYLFSKLQEHMPRTWTDLESFHRDMEEDQIYVYKPSGAEGGTGIRFLKGPDVSQLARDARFSSWVIQTHVHPFLYDGRKTHLRALSLVIVQPSGEYEFFLYKTMKIFAAAEKYDEQRLIHGEDVSSMLLTNLRQSKIWFKQNSVEGMVFDYSNYALNATNAFGSSDSGIKFEDVYDGIKNTHAILYSTMGHLFKCKATDVSIYDDACFHIIASDMAVDNRGKPYFLEGNMAMGVRNLWADSEIQDYSSGAAALIKAPDSPYSVKKSPRWEKIEVHF